MLEPMQMADDQPGYAVSRKFILMSLGVLIFTVLFMFVGTIFVINKTHCDNLDPTKVFVVPQNESTDEYHSNVVDVEKPYVRLPRSIVPITYHIKLIPPYLNNITKHANDFKESDFKFYGDITIRIKVLEETTNITLHILDLEINPFDVMVWSINSQGKQAKDTVRIEKQYEDKPKQFYIIKLFENLKFKQLYDIHIKYAGVLNEHMMGFYRSSYQSRGVTR